MQRNLHSAWWAVPLALLVASLARGAELSVSPAGSDSNPGTTQQPLQTLAGAQQALRAAKKASAAAPITITLAAGTYYLKAPLVLTPEDSGTQQAAVVWQAAPGASVVLSGGRKLELAWTPFRDGIFKCQVPDDFAPDQLFVNGERQIMARYPNFDPSVLIFNGYAADCISASRAARWTDPAGGYMHAMHPGQWGGFSYLITGKNDNGEVMLQGGWQGNRPAKPHAKYRFVENIFEELDAPGEWFLNSKTHTLYFYPPPGVDLANAIVESAQLRHLIEFRGTQQSPVKFVTLRGLTFQHTARTFMETKEPLLRSDWTIYRGGAVLFDGAEDCTLADSFLDQLGGNAVFVNNYNRRVSVRGCRIEQAGAGGVMFVGDPQAVRNPLFEYRQQQPIEQISRQPGPQSDNYPADCHVEDCLITRVGRYEKQAAGVGLDMCARITVSHCSIYDLPRAGINIGDGCWGGHVVEFCDVFDTVKETGDHGSFNSWGRDRYWLPNATAVEKLVAANPELPLLDAVQPTTLRNNRWRCDHGWDIDLDDGSSNYRIINNLCLHGGLKNREGYRRIVENNVIASNSFHPHVWFENSGDVFTHNIVFTKYQPVRMPKTWGKTVDFNLLHDPSTPTSAPAVELQKVSNQDSHSVRADAMFVDPAHGNYTVREGSAALALGFKNFPMDQFGVTSPALRAIARTPSFAHEREAASTRDPAVREWPGGKIRNIVGRGEQSAHGLPTEAGALVLTVPADRAREKTGLQVGDVIVAINGSQTETTTDLLQITGNITAGTTFKLTVVRDQQNIEITATK